MSIFNNVTKKTTKMSGKKGSRKRNNKKGKSSPLWWLGLVLVLLVAAQKVRKDPELKEAVTEQVKSVSGEVKKIKEALPKAPKLSDLKLMDEADDWELEKGQTGSLPYRDLEIPVMKKEKEGQQIRHKGYTLSYNESMRTPFWVAWEITRQELKGNEKRTNEFVPDPKVKGAKAYTYDYTSSGYDRGHMAPAADMKWSATAMEESFYMTNICPQVPSLNRGDWNDLEEKVRAWAKRYGSAYVACGPIYRNKNPKRIGKHKVGVPDAFFKVVLVKKGLQVETIGFVFENRKGNAPLKQYARPVKEIERLTGMDFFSALPDDIEKRAEGNCNALRKELKN